MCSCLQCPQLTELAHFFFVGVLNVLLYRGRSTCGTTHVARLEFPRETGLILRCARKPRNPFRTMQGNRLSCRDQEGRRGSDDGVAGTSVFPSTEPGMLGNFWVSQEGCQGPLRPSVRNRGLPLRHHRGQGPHLAKRWEPRCVTRVEVFYGLGQETLGSLDLCR